MAWVWQYWAQHDHLRSNYMLPETNHFTSFRSNCGKAGQDFNYNAMISQRSILNLFHSDSQRDAFVRRANAMMLAGADAELADLAQLRRELPFLDFDNAPYKGGLYQRRRYNAA